MTTKRRMLISDAVGPTAEPLQKNPLPREFGLNLDTVAKARLWLTNPHNWFQSETTVLKWDGLVPLICRRRGLRLHQEPWDNGIAELVVMDQIKFRRAGRVDVEPLITEE